MSAKRSKLLESIDLSLEDAATIDLAMCAFCDLQLVSRLSCARISERLDNVILYGIQSYE